MENQNPLNVTHGREVRIKPTRRCHLTPGQGDKRQNVSAKMWRNQSPRAPLLGCKMVLCLWKTVCLLLKSAQIELSSRPSLSFLLCFPQSSACGPPDFGRTHSLSCIKISNFQASGGWWGAGQISKWVRVSVRGVCAPLLGGEASTPLQFGFCFCFCFNSCFFKRPKSRFFHFFKRSLNLLNLDVDR